MKNLRSYLNGLKCKVCDLSRGHIPHVAVDVLPENPQPNTIYFEKSTGTIWFVDENGVVSKMSGTQKLYIEQSFQYIRFSKDEVNKEGFVFRSTSKYSDSISKWSTTNALFYIHPSGIIPDDGYKLKRVWWTGGEKYGTCSDVYVRIRYARYHYYDGGGCGYYGSNSFDKSEIIAEFPITNWQYKVPYEVIVNSEIVLRKNDQILISMVRKENTSDTNEGMKGLDVICEFEK